MYRVKFHSLLKTIFFLDLGFIRFDKKDEENKKQRNENFVTWT